jgi:cytoskeleton-associated protein 5
MSEEADLLREAAKLPLDERATHSNWKVRSAAFEDIKAKVERVFSEDDPSLADYGEFCIRLLGGDDDAGGQERQMRAQRACARVCVYVCAHKLQCTRTFLRCC